MNTETNRLSLPAASAKQYPALSGLAENGLPNRIDWHFATSGPTYSFDFARLHEGGQVYDGAAAEMIDRYMAEAAPVLLIGIYAYSFLDLRRVSDVGVSTANGNMWIIDPSCSSIVRVPGHEGEFERIPFSFQFLNTDTARFEQVLDQFLPLTRRSPDIAPVAPPDRAGWLALEGEIRNIDPLALHHETAFWQCIIGDRLGPF